MTRAVAFILFLASLTSAQGCSMQWLGVAIYEAKRDRELDRMIEERQLEAQK